MADGARKVEFPCEVCGRPITPGPAARCEACKRFACRDCLKIHYHIDANGAHIPTQTFCYDCWHAKY